MTRILAIDPGYDRCGIAIVDVENNTGTLVHSSCITTEKKSSLSERLVAVHDGLQAAIDKWRPNAIAIETLIVSVNKKTVIAVAEARGVALLAAGRNSLEAIELSPQEVKTAMTGVGNARKEQVQKMAALTLKLDLSGKLDDEIDAIAVGFAAIGKLKMKLLQKGENPVAKKNGI